MNDIQKVSKQDYQQLVDLWEKASRKSHSFLDENEITLDKSRLITDYFPTMALYKIEKEERIVAFIGLCQEWIEMLFVDPDYQKKGIGKKLVSFACQGKPLVRVDSYEKNEDASAFYQKMGFHASAKSEIEAGGKKLTVMHLKKISNQINPVVKIFK